MVCIQKGIRPAIAIRYVGDSFLILEKRKISIRPVEDSPTIHKIMRIIIHKEVEGFISISNVIGIHRAEGIVIPKYNKLMILGLMMADPVLKIYFIIYGVKKKYPIAARIIQIV